LKYIHGRPIHLSTSDDGCPESLNVTLRDSDGADVGETTIPCTDLIVTAGPWTGRVLEKLGLPSLPVTNLPGHSIIVRAAPEHPISATAVFASIYGANRQPRGRTTESPELFPRGDGTVYVAGENNAEPMPDDPADVGGLVDDDIAERLVRATKHISDGLACGAVEKRQVSLFRRAIEAELTHLLQLCYRPTVTDGRPLVGKLKDGVWVATGSSTPFGSAILSARD
jgi:glycine/D-amino acid oxidase-like deaminating enzyme